MIRLTAMFSLLASTAMAGEIWVTNEKDDTISVISTDTLEVIKTYDTGERPRGILFNSDYSRVYICASDSNAVQVMDPNSGEILHELPSGDDPEQFVLHPDDRHLYIANEDDAITTVVDVETRKVVAQIDVGVEPEGPAEAGGLRLGDTLLSLDDHALLDVDDLSLALSGNAGAKVQLRLARGEALTEQELTLGVV